MSRRDEGISQQTEDAIVNRICQRLAEKGLLGDSLRDLEATGERQLVEDCLDRHEKRMRAAGEKGW